MSRHGFTIGNTTLTRLSGPVSAYLLKPTSSFLQTMKEQGVTPPLFFFLGDTHFSNSGLCPKCKCKRGSHPPQHSSKREGSSSKRCDCCVSIDEDKLFSLLNPFSTPEHPVHVYLEWFLSKEYKQRVEKLSPTKAKDLLHYQIERLTPEFHGPLNRIYAKNYACFFPEWKENPSLRSVFQEYCPHQNIQWHHVDLRKVINTTNFRAYDDREDMVILGQYLYEGLIDWILMEEPFEAFRNLLWYNPAQAAVELVSGFWKYDITHEEAAVVCDTIATLFTSVDAFVQYFFNEDNIMFTRRCALYKQIRKQVPRLRRIETNRVWAKLMLNRYVDAHHEGWFEEQLEKGLSRYPKAYHAKNKHYIKLFFREMSSLLRDSDQLSAKQILEHDDGWKQIRSSRPSVLSEEYDPSGYLKGLMEDFGLGATCTFVDMAILLRSFKIPVNRKTGQSEPTPFLSIAYFGNDHIVSMYKLLVDDLKMYEPVDQFIEVEDVRPSRKLRCLNLDRVKWNLVETASQIGIDLSDVKINSPRSTGSPIRQKLIQQVEKKREAYNKKKYRRRSGSKKAKRSQSRSRRTSRSSRRRSI